MSSTERAPEPTMEEILASIRRIISDDEANSNHQQATSSDYAGPVAVEGTDDGASPAGDAVALVQSLRGSVMVNGFPLGIELGS